jgi:starch phosphorylase
MDSPTIAYFSMEFGLDTAMPTYSGGLGVLAGDTVRAAADQGISMVGVTLLYRKGYFQQHLDSKGNQTDSPVEWSPARFLTLLPVRVVVTIGGHQVHVQAWRYMVRGEFGHSVPIYFLDTGLPENDPWDRSLSDWLYGGDQRYRLSQEVVLGLGGVAMLRVLGYSIHAYHMNEGHSALIALALLEEHTWGHGLQSAGEEDMEAVRRRCIFTTHTPVAAGHDVFPLGLVRDVLGETRSSVLLKTRCCSDSSLNMTELALRSSRYVNGVSMRHEEVARSMFATYPIDSVTNGVHALSWVSPSFGVMYDRHIPEWRRDNFYLRYAVSIPLEEIREAHRVAKGEMLSELRRRTGVQLDPAVLTVGFARRATEYKRTDLLFRDLDRLRRIAQSGPLQVVCAGKAHPRDEGGKELIRRIFGAAARLRGSVPVVYVEEYDMGLARYLCSGVDLWLNTPQRPREASGTSGMKAALNGIPSFSILDGWWVEGHVEGVTGWAIGDDTEMSTERELASLYSKLENVIIPMYYRRPEEYARIMRSAIALNGSYFNAQRMVLQYVQNAYLRAGVTGKDLSDTRRR